MTTVVRLAHALSRALPRRGLRGLAKAVVNKIRRQGLRGLLAAIRVQFARLEDDKLAYERWVSATAPSASDLARMRATAESLTFKPVFSIAMPVYNVEERWLRRAIESVIVQSYPWWELCIADDASTLPHVRPVLEEYASNDARIRLVFRETNGHISEATNTALGLTAGDYVVLMDNDDELAPEALFEFARKLNEVGPVDMIYSDEDKLCINGERLEPFFKPDWSPEYLEACMYTAHLACYRASLVRELGGFRRGFEGAQDYDFMLRFAERAGRIEHVPKVLYHWRVLRGSTAASMAEKDYVTDAACRALAERLERTGRRGRVFPSDFAGCFWVQDEVKGEPLVSIFIPTAGRSATIRGTAVDLLANCIRGIRSRTDYSNYELIVVDNNDLRDESRQVIQEHGCRLVHYYEPFNVASKMNLGAAHASGEYLLFLNDDIEVINRDWLRNMLHLVQREGVGVVGAKLFFEDGTLQHVGVAFDDDGLPDHILRGHPGRDLGYFFSAVGTRNYLAVTGACLMTPRNLFRKLGGFSETFAVNYNDIDYCLKAYEAGYRIVFTPHARLYHFESKTRERVVAQAEIDLFRQRWAKVTCSDPYYSRLFQSKPPNFALRLT